MKNKSNSLKMQLLFSLVLVGTGVSLFIYNIVQQQKFNEVAKEKQTAAIFAMRKKEVKEHMLSSSKKNVQKTIDEQSRELLHKKVDYLGKDVKPMTRSEMERVDVFQTIQLFGEGEIEIPRIKMALPILEGTSQSNLSVGAGTMKAGQRVRKGNFALAGHYMTSSGLLFGGINQLERKDQIYLTYKKEQAVYEVTETKVISEKAGSVIFDSQGEKLLTLITCDRAITGTHRRFMVRATLVEKK